MKRIIYILSIAVVLAVSACKKEAATQHKGVPIPVSNEHLAGTWKVIGNMISSGGPMYFVPTTGNYHVTFQTDGTMLGSEFPDFVTYTLKTDSSIVRMTKADNSTYQNYLTTISSDTLTMSPFGPSMCIEGCAIKLVKQ